VECKKLITEREVPVKDQPEREEVAKPQPETDGKLEEIFGKVQELGQSILGLQNMAENQEARLKEVEKFREEITANLDSQNTAIENLKQDISQQIAEIQEKANAQIQNFALPNDLITAKDLDSKIAQLSQSLSKKTASPSDIIKKFQGEIEKCKNHNQDMEEEVRKLKPRIDELELGNNQLSRELSKIKSTRAETEIPRPIEDKIKPRDIGDVLNNMKAREERIKLIEEVFKRENSARAEERNKAPIAERRYTPSSKTGSVKIQCY